MKIKNEKIFVRFADKDDRMGGSFRDVQPSEIGRMQFFDLQSKGIKPSDPDPYFNKLMVGKTGFDFICSEYRKMYLSGEWWGFDLLWEDWEGERWVLPRLCSWYEGLTGRPLPKWLGLEMTREERDKADVEYFKMIVGEG
jgi:hypothetical protein